MNRAVFTALVALAALPAFAQPADGRGPPQEAIAACQTRAVGAACTVTLHGESLDGTCKTAPDGSTVACLPTKFEGVGGPGGHHGPPPEAKAACTSKAKGESCSVTTPEGKTVTGTCDAPPQSTELACRPAGGPGGHRGPPPEALSVCQGKSTGTACSITTPDSKILNGTCETGPEGSTLACRPSGPPPRN
jgi:hypothetical protein